MSTKIYNVYKFSGSPDELMAHLRNFRKKWLELQTERFFEMVKDLDLEECKKIMQQMEDDTRKQYNRWIDLDIKGSCVVYFHKGNIYVQFFIDISPFKISVPVFVGEDNRFQDFHYQDQSDPWYWEMESKESELDEAGRAELAEVRRDWKERKQIWDEIFSQDYWGNPASCGLSYDFAGVLDTYKVRDDVVSKLNKRIAQ